MVCYGKLELVGKGVHKTILLARDLRLFLDLLILVWLCLIQELFRMLVGRILLLSVQVILNRIFFICMRKNYQVKVVFGTVILKILFLVLVVSLFNVTLCGGAEEQQI